MIIHKTQLYQEKAGTEIKIQMLATDAVAKHLIASVHGFSVQMVGAGYTFNSPDDFHRARLPRERFGTRFGLDLAQLYPEGSLIFSHYPGAEYDQELIELTDTAAPMRAWEGVFNTMRLVEAPVYPVQLFIDNIISQRVIDVFFPVPYLNSWLNYSEYPYRLEVSPLCALMSEIAYELKIVPEKMFGDYVKKPSQHMIGD